MASREEELLAAILGENWTECEPHSRIEKIWQYALEVSGVEPEPAHSRIEALAIQVAELVRNGGGGGGRLDDWTTRHAWLYRLDRG